VIPGAQIADLAAGAMQAVIGILLALAARARTGRGQMVDISMLDGVASLMAAPLALYQATGQAPKRGGALLTGRYGCYRLYQAADGRWLAVGALEPKFWSELCRRLGCERFIHDQFAEGTRRLEIIGELARIFRSRAAQEWFEILRTSDTCVTPVRDPGEVMEDLALDHWETPVTPRLGETPGQLGGPPPRLGEHTREILERGGTA
jgi:crotonobetainyl-CoA:carnitine CoA-transferase CaiB-like acyl-CoA transferase